MSRYRIPFGRYNGRPINRVQNKYLDWVISDTTFRYRMPEAFEQIAGELQGRKEEDRYVCTDGERREIRDKVVPFWRSRRERMKRAVAAALVKAKEDEPHK